MRLLQLLILALLVTVGKGDTFATGSSTLSQFHPTTGFEVLYHSDTSCSTPTLSGHVFAECSYATDYGHPFLSLTDSGSGDSSEGGCDGCSPLLGAQNEATVGFRDRIIFYGPPGKTVSVGWSFDINIGFSFNQGTYGDIGFSVAFPFDSVTFDVPYDMSIVLSGWLGIFGDCELFGDISCPLFESADVKVNGFHVFDTPNPVCTNYDSPASICGPPIDVSIHTASGFLYGGHTPEPSSLLLLVTAALALLVSRSGQIAHNFGLRRWRRDS